MHTVTALADDGTLVVADASLLERPGPKWIDVMGPTPEVMEQLRERYGLHRLAVEDCLKQGQRPKLEEYPNHTFIVLQGYGPGTVPTEPKMREVHFILFPDLLITVHQDAAEVVSEARRRLGVEPASSFGRGADFVAYAVADALMDANFPVVDALDSAVETLEDGVFEHAHEEQLQQMSALRQAMVEMRRVLSPQRDVLGLLSRRGTPLVQERTAIYYRDVYDHLIRVLEQLDAARELLASARDAWLSVIANRTNDISKQLTIFATIFLPLSFITGFFGQNFDELGGHAWFVAMLVMIFGLPLLLVAWFRIKRWI